LASLHVFHGVPGDGACIPFYFKNFPETGQVIVLGILVAFLIIGTAEFFSADVAGIGLRTLDVGFYVSNETVFL